MKVLFIGGTGNISTACSELAVERGMDLYLLNRGQREVEIAGAKSIVADIHDPAEAAKAVEGHTFDAVVNFIAFSEADIERDLALFGGRAKQYVFISSASVYQKPLVHPIVTESTPLRNPYWEYARKKIACEERLNRAYREEGFPAVIVRPSLTYDTVIPLAIGSWGDVTMIERMRQGRPVVVQGDGSSLWTITHAADFAKGLVGLLGNQEAVGHPFHITSDELLTWDQIWQYTAAAAGCEAKIVHVPSDFIAEVAPGQKGGLLGDKSWSAIFDNSKIKRFVPGFEATIPYREGIKRTLAWFEEKPGRQRIVDGHDEIHDKILAAWGRK
ncbi:MAG: SDR family oxidoreductase [Phycisphaeraceae bacterium]